MPKSFDNEVKGLVESLLRMIEASHGVKIVNLAEISGIIFQNIGDKNGALNVCSAINTWITINNIQGRVTIPEKLVTKYINALGSS